MDNVRFAKLDYAHPDHGLVTQVNCTVCEAQAIFPRKQLTPIAVAEWEAKHRREKH